MSRHACHTLFACLLLLCVGGNWHFAQLMAWTAMVHERAPEMGFMTAVSSVLSGEEPCERCEAIRCSQEQQQERSPAHLADGMNKIHLVVTSFGSMHPPLPPLLVELSTATARCPKDGVPDIPTPPPEQV